MMWMGLGQGEIDHPLAPGQLGPWLGHVAGCGAVFCPLHMTALEALCGWRCAVVARCFCDMVLCSVVRAASSWLTPCGAGCLRTLALQQPERRQESGG